MKALLLAACLLVPAIASPGSAGAWFFRPGGDRLDASRKLFDAGRYPDVIAQLNPETLLKLRRRDLQRAYLYLGESYERTRQADKALSIYQLGVRLFPRDTVLLAHLGQILHAYQLNEQAQAAYSRLLKVDPMSTPAHLGMAEIYHSLGFLSRSADHYEKALEALKTDAGLWRDYAEVLLEQREFKTAELAARKSLELKPSPETTLVLAAVRRAQGELQDALELLGGLVAASPKFDEGLVSAYALWLFESGNHEKAGKQVESLLKASPDQPLARWIRARIHLKAGHRTEAVRDLGVAAAGRSAFTAEASSALLKQLSTSSLEAR